MHPGFKAYLTMRTVGEGSRPYPFTAGYCPDLRLGPGGDRLAVRVAEVAVSPKPGSVGPGDAAVVRFERVWPGWNGYDVLTTGAAFEVLEGDRVIGTGEIIPDEGPPRKDPR